MAAVAGAHVVVQRLDLDQQPERLQFLHDLLAAFLARHPGEPAGVFVHRAVVVQHAQDRQVVALRDLEVVRVVRRGHLDRAGAELEVGVFVGDDRKLAVHQRQRDRLSDHMRVARVVRIHADAGVAEHRLRARRRDDDVAEFAGVADVPEVRILLLVLDLGVRERRHAGRAPVDDARAAVDEPLFVEPDERLAHGAAQALVHREPLARPVAGDAELAKLLDDLPAVLALPRPRALEEFLAAEVLLRDALFFQRLDDLDLGRDRGVVGARHPQRRVALHAVVADQQVFRRDKKRMPQMQPAGDVRRRNNDDKGLDRRVVSGLVRVIRRAKIPLALPLGINLFFVFLKVIGLWQLGHLLFLNIKIKTFAG